MKKEYIVYKLSECAKQACRIDNELFTKYNVKRGLRNEDGTGVLVGLTKIGNVVGYERTDHMRCCVRNVSALRKWLICCFRENSRTVNSWLRSRN